MSGVALRRRSLLSRLGFRPQIRSGVRQLHWCGSASQREVGHRTSDAHKGMAALGAQKQQRQLRVRHVSLSLWLGRAHDGVHCSGSGQAGAWCHEDRSLTLPPSMYSGRCTNIAACRYRGASGESTVSAISRTNLRTATWRQSHLLLQYPSRTQQLAANIRWAWRWASGIGVHIDMGRVSCTEDLQDAICYSLSTKLQP